MAGYRPNAAANCFDLAKEFPDPERKLALLDMAAAWHGEITENFGDTRGWKAATYSHQSPSRSARGQIARLGERGLR